MPRRIALERRSNINQVSLQIRILHPKGSLGEYHFSLPSVPAFSTSWVAFCRECHVVGIRTLHLPRMKQYARDVVDMASKGVHLPRLGLCAEQNRTWSGCRSPESWSLHNWWGELYQLNPLHTVHLCSCLDLHDYWASLQGWNLSVPNMNLCWQAAWCKD